MKRLWIGVALLLVLLAGGIAATCFSTRTHNTIADTLQEASRSALAGNWKDAYALYNGAKARWEQHRKCTASISDHAPMEEIDRLFSQADVYLRLRERGAFSACCAGLGVMTQAVGETHAVSWWGLL